jgi:Asp/Glu/hydantoin racemase
MPTQVAHSNINARSGRSKLVRVAPASVPKTPLGLTTMETTQKRLLLINPNTTVAVTQRLTAFLQDAFPNSMQLDAVTANFGARYIACEASHAVAAHAALDSWAQYVASAGAPDGVLIGCFGDPGLFALRQSSACPVTGLAEASFMEAAAYGAFAVVTGGQRWKPMLSRLAHNLGFGQQLHHIEIVQPTGAQLMADPTMALACLGAACDAAQAKGVQAIIIGGAGLAGYAQLLQARSAVPLIDSAAAGVRVLLGGGLPEATGRNGFDADWGTVSAPMQALKIR